MESNIEKYKKDLDRLISDGEKLNNYIALEFHPHHSNEELKRKKEIKLLEIKEKKPFTSEYETWYSESLILLKQVLPERVEDFVALYKTNAGKNLKVTDLTLKNYGIEYALLGIRVTRGHSLDEEIVGPSSAIPRFSQQLNILKSAKRRFESSLFDLKHLVQAGLFDSELDAAKELNQKGFMRGAGAMASVVIERHLAQVCNKNQIKITKEKSTINDYAQQLKNGGIIEQSVWRFIQHLSDLRALCGHDTKRGPTKDDVEELIKGISKIIKTVL